MILFLNLLLDTTTFPSSFRTQTRKDISKFDITKPHVPHPSPGPPSHQHQRRSNRVLNSSFPKEVYQKPPNSPTQKVNI